MSVGFEQMLVFTTVLDTGSFAAAARVLNVTRSTISRRVESLENRLGQRLLQRNGRVLSPTEIGRLYYERCREVLGSLEAAEDAVRSWGDEPRGRLRVSTTPFFAHHFLAPVVTQYLRRHPHMSIDLHLSNEMVDPIRHRIDVFVRAGELSDSSFIVRKLGIAEALFCASPRYLAAHGHPEAWHDLRDHACIVVGNVLQKIRWQMFGGREQVLDVSPRLTVNSLEFARQAALEDLGIARLPMTMIARDLERGRLVPVWEDHRVNRGYIYLGYPSREHLPLKTRAFVDSVIEMTSV